MARMHVLVITGLTLPTIDEGDVERIRQAAGPGSRVSVATSAEEALAAASDVEVILGSITPALFRAAPSLRWVHTITSGVDAFLFPEMRDSDVVLTSEKGIVGEHLADHAFALLLALTRGIAKTVRYGDAVWEHRMEFRRSNVELTGMTMGIVGLGGTGRAVAHRAGAFGMRCRAVDIDPVHPTTACPLVQDMTRFDELLADSDVLAICCPLTAESRGLVGRHALARIKPGAYIVNVTRGPIIDDAALLEALRSGRVAGAGLDVVPDEPLPRDHPFWTAPNIVMTPHTAGASQFRAGRNIERFCGNLRRLREGAELEGAIDKHRGF
ncbi:MAG: D-2-hydroxyacid dehydrogenase [Chloroflexi bacterium]|nr:D-2-hydroxyacid dehydrogenase [Chloroflexota bacterium]